MSAVVPACLSLPTPAIGHDRVCCCVLLELRDGPRISRLCYVSWPWLGHQLRRRVIRSLTSCGVPAGGWLLVGQPALSISRLSVDCLSAIGGGAHFASVAHLSAATAASYAASRSFSATQPCLLTASRHSISSSAGSVSTLCRPNRPTRRGNRTVDSRATLLA